MRMCKKERVREGEEGIEMGVEKDKKKGRGGGLKKGGRKKVERDRAWQS
jgi:hypothetical protein